MTKLLRQQYMHDDNERNNTHDNNEPKTHNSHVMSGESAVNLKVLGSEILCSWLDKIKFLRITVNLDRIQLGNTVCKNFPNKRSNILQVCVGSSSIHVSLTTEEFIS